ncbi:hypothetical protein L484_007714 [Morus notabilis]|uniref:Uncharacterized protein n=1 Tax=Morus notabilis TaxID=981085 RepID=W9RXL5_9ROSA|nr:hypothetical protein L484_007714 [Morus notabilis]
MSDNRTSVINRWFSDRLHSTVERCPIGWSAHGVMEFVCSLVFNHVRLALSYNDMKWYLDVVRTGLELRHIAARISLTACQDRDNNGIFVAMNHSKITTWLAIATKSWLDLDLDQDRVATGRLCNGFATWFVTGRGRITT